MGTDVFVVLISGLALLFALLVWAWRQKEAGKALQKLLAIGLLLTALATATIGLRLIVWMEQSERRMQAAEAWQRYWAQRVNEEKATQESR